MLLKNKYIYVTSNRNVPDVFVPDKPITYYQMCTFPDYQTGRYHMRKITYDGNSNPTSITNYYLTPEQQNLFYTYKKSYEYKDYPYHDFTQVDLPTQALLDQARSELFTDKVCGKDYKCVGSSENRVI